MKLLGFFMIAILAASCCGNEDISSALQDEYIKGVVIIRAEADYELGVIRIADVFSDDEYLESPSRAILYAYEGGQPLDLFDTIYFKIGYRDGLKYAQGVTLSRPTASLMSKRDQYSILNKFDLNLHNADPHREGPRHKIKHRAPKSVLGSVPSEDIHVITFYDPNSSFAGSESYYIYTTTPHEVQENTDYFLGVSNVVRIGDAVDGNGNVVVPSHDPSTVYEMSLSHNHAISGQ